MVLSVLLKFLYPASPNLAIEVLAVAGFLSLSSGGWNEIKGKHMQYSKLRDKNNLSQQLLQKNDKDEEAKKMKMKMIKRKAEVPSQVGMLVLYTPAFLAGLSSFFIVPYGGDFRFNVLRSAVALHFFKRVLEVRTKCCNSLPAYIFFVLVLKLIYLALFFSFLVQIL